MKLGLLRHLFTSLFRGHDQKGRPNFELMRILGHKFSNPSLLNNALTHRSTLREEGDDYSQANELLEFLGDAVLDLVVVEKLFRSFPEKHEGDLSKLKSMMVSGKALQKIARDIDLGNFIIMSRNEARNGGRSRGSILEDTFEAVIAAIYLDGGMEAARKFIDKKVLTQVDELVNGDFDNNFKSQLLEYAQGMGIPSPVYRIMSENGPEHRKRFEIEVSLNGKSFGMGIGHTKKSAQQKAAHAAIEQLSIS
ncbi:MAG: ribonuclease III [Candidatus Hatepunaea meridiana]|nr:ribonuclease III [Candidatus Hatepunaea meridiana]